MESCKDELFDGLRSRNWNEEQLDQLWKDMIDYSSYSFNKSHAVAYAILAYQMAKLKCYHPTNFMISLLNSIAKKKVDVSNYINECKNLGINILPPSIIHSDGYFKLENESDIRYGLLPITTVGEPTVSAINEIRSNLNDGFTLINFLNENSKIENSIAKDSIVNLIKSGSFDHEDSDRKKQMISFIEWNYTPTIYKPRKTHPSKSDFTKKGWIVSENIYKDKEKRLELFNHYKLEEYNENEKIRKSKHIENSSKLLKNSDNYEFDSLGVYLTLSPFDKFSHLVKPLSSYNNGDDKIFNAGTILEKEVKKSPRGGSYAKLVIVNDKEVFRAKAYSGTLEEFKEILTKDNVLIFLGNLKNEEFVIKRVMTLEKWKSMKKKKK